MSNKKLISAAVPHMRIDGKIDPELADEQWDKNTDHIKREAAIPLPAKAGSPLAA